MVVGVASDASAGVIHQVNGQPRQLPPEASLAVYRTAQEALANALEKTPAMVRAALASSGAVPARRSWAGSSRPT